MSSSDIYQARDLPQAKKEPPKKRRRRYQSRESFDEAVNKDVSRTHQRRSKNSGFRRFQHLMRKPEFSKKFWTIAIIVFAVIIGSIILWDQFFRYSGPEDEAPRNGYGNMLRPSAQSNLSSF